MATSKIKAGIVYKEFNHAVTVEGNASQGYLLSDLGVTIPTGSTLANIYFAISGANSDKGRVTVAGSDYSTIVIYNNNSTTRNWTLYMKCLFV